MADDIELNSEKFPSKMILGEPCWSPAIAAKAVNVSKNTIINWTRRATEMGVAAMPFYKKGKGSRIWIPVRKFIEWYRYSGQN